MKILNFSLNVNEEYLLMWHDSTIQIYFCIKNISVLEKLVELILVDNAKF